MKRLELLCRTQAHCVTCRQKEFGRGFRESVVQSLEEKPADGIDFSCPFGKKWGKGKQEITGLGDLISKWLKKIGFVECGKCNKRRQYLNKVFPFKEK